ncbi:hypothetical protein [Rhodoferax saidenbachensis]|uniref:PilZ domain-containing protein n=1 Tax=Rhodoferax saidenbachensis TaxID=1484693 RepID=A0ABU1ZPM2_9BURK|nr:hypothetical protein [Rhodoferax saidenbachensis]MDR7307338.1 hypothetical protein [Rhodoferax saidenbachensis]
MVTRKFTARPPAPAAQRAPLSLRLERPKLTVSLRRNAVKAFVIAKNHQVVIGIVRWGLEYGLLAISETGDYLRVNGSYVELLEPQEVRAAIIKVFMSGELPQGRSAGDGPPVRGLEFLDATVRRGTI